MIADELGISKSLVSLALADKYGVNDEVKLKVKKSAIKMGYIQDAKKKSKTSQRTVSVLASSDCFLPLDSFWNTIITSVENRLNISDYRVNYIVLPKGFDVKNGDGIFAKDKSLGIIAILSTAEIAEYVLKTQKPAVFIDPKEEFSFEHARVMASNKTAGYSAAKYLADKGHKKIAFLGNTCFSFSFRHRYTGFCNYITMNGGIVGADLHDEIIGGEVYYSTDNFEAVTAGSGITGVVCANDWIALNLYRHLRLRGIKIPDDISVIGIDDMHETRFSNPPLTTMHIPRREIGEGAADIIIKMIEEGSIVAGMEYKARLIERESVKDLRAEKEQ